MKLSVVIPCRNEVNYIEDCIDAIYENELPFGTELYVYVVDGISDDGTRELLIKLKEKYTSLELVENLKQLKNLVFLNLDHNKIGNAGLIDDAGIFIEALKGFPGVYSRYTYDTIGLEGILQLMKGVKNRRTTFKCVLGFLQNNGKQYILTGETHGILTKKKKGEQGFGYDPIFIPEGEEKTFAELDMNRKNQISHRGKALEKLLEILSTIDI